MKTPLIVARALSLITATVFILCTVLPLTAAPGDLDPTFGNNGKAITQDVGFNSAWGQDAALQADGKLVAVGWVMTGSSSNSYRTEFAVVRYQPDGTLDESFGNSGRVTTGIDLTLGSRARAVVIQPDGKLLVAGMAGLGFGLARYHPDGTLDNSFGASGVLTTLIAANGAAQAFDLALQPDGKIIAAGYANPPSGSDIALVRYNADGRLDPTFGVAGQVLTDSGKAGDGAEDLALQADGKIVVVGRLASDLGDDFALLRYTVDGVLDPTFATNGIAMLDFGDTSDVASALQIQSDGKILVAGSSAGSFALARFTANGALDTTFGVDGKVKTELAGSSGHINALALQSNGRIVAAGLASVGNKSSFAAARYMADGHLDTGFGADGWIVTNVRPELGSSGESLVLPPDGKLVVAGHTMVYQTMIDTAPEWYRSAFAIIRYHADGALDATFGTDGEAITPFLRHSGAARSLTVQPDGKILVAGRANTNLKADFAVTLYDSNGKLDPRFGMGGRVVTDYRTSDDWGTKVLVQADGKVLVAGDYNNARPGGDSYGFVILRYSQDGRLDSTFGYKGAAVISPYAGTLTDMLLQPDGRIIILAQEGEQCLLGRFSPTGTLDPTFGESGLVTIDLGQGYEYCNAAALQADEKLVVAGMTTSGGAGEDFMVLRYQGNGTPDTTFGKQGVVITDVPSAGEAFSIVVQADGKLTIAGYLSCRE